VHSGRCLPYSPSTTSRAYSMVDIVDPLFCSSVYIIRTQHILRRTFDRVYLYSDTKSINSLNLALSGPYTAAEECPSKLSTSAPFFLHLPQAEFTATLHNPSTSRLLALFTALPLLSCQSSISIARSTLHNLPTIPNAIRNKACSHIDYRGASRAEYEGTGSFLEPFALL